MKLAFEPVIPSLIVLTPWLRMFHRPDRTVVTTRMRGHHGTPKASRAVTLRLWGQRWSNRSMARAGSGRRHPGGRVTIRTRSKERTTRGRPSISFSLSLADLEYDATIRGGRGSVLPRDVAGWPAPRSRRGRRLRVPRERTRHRIHDRAHPALRRHVAPGMSLIAGPRSWRDRVCAEGPIGARPGAPGEQPRRVFETTE